MARIWPCGAKTRGGGGAPPTTLILLRNQRRQRQDAARHRASPGPSEGAPGWSGALSVRNPEKILFFFEGGCCLFGVDGWGCGNRLRRCGRRGWRGPPPPPMAELCETEGGTLPGPVPLTAMFLGHNLRGATGVTPGVGPRLAHANGLPLPATVTPLRGPAVPCLAGGALPTGHVPPNALKRRVGSRRSPSP